MLLVFGHGEARHLLLGQLSFFLDFVSPLQIATNVMCCEILVNTLWFVERGVEEKVHEVFLSQESVLFSVEHFEEANDAGVILGLVFMSAPFDESDACFWGEFTLIVTVDAPPFFENLLSCRSEAPVLSVNEICVGNVFSLLNLSRNNYIVLFEVELLQHHTVHAFINDSVVWQAELHVLGCEPQHLRYLAHELPHRSTRVYTDHKWLSSSHGVVLDDDPVEEFSLKDSVVRLNTSSASLLTFLDDALEDQEDTLGDSTVLTLLAQQFHALFDKVLDDLWRFFLEAFIEAQVSFNQKADCFGDDVVNFTVENDSPNQICAV